MKEREIEGIGGDDFFILDRNQGLIPEWVQEKIKQTKVLLVGCGLGSQIATLAARTGFRYFELWDGDKVEESNLNRQNFGLLDVGFNKSVSTRLKIESVNINAEVKHHERFLRRVRDIKAAVRRNDFIINMADPMDVMYKISATAQLKGKIEIHPLNLGWIGYCLILSCHTPTLKRIVGGKIIGMEFYPRLVKATLGEIKLPKEIDLDKVLAGEMPFPQLGITSYFTAALVVGAMVKILAGEEVPMAPQPLICNPWG